jgi:hypothetical protein
MFAKLFLLLSASLNVVFFGGDPDESLSARAWRQRGQGWDGARARIDRWLGEGHCQRVFTSQRTREQARHTQ